MTVRVSNFETSKAFYDCVLAPLGFGDAHLHEGFAEWGDFSITQDGKPLSENLHIAFAAKSREDVDSFHRVAMEAGYSDNGAPGERPSYHEGYYGAYVLDPERSNTLVTL